MERPARRDAANRRSTRETAAFKFIQSRLPNDATTRRRRNHDTEYTKSGSITLTERVWVDQGGDWDDSLPSWTAEFGPWRREDSDSDSDS